MKSVGICSSTSIEWFFAHCFQIELEFGLLVFWSEKPNNNNYIYQFQESNPGHTGGRRVLSPLRFPYFPPVRTGMDQTICREWFTILKG